MSLSQQLEEKVLSELKQIIIQCKTTENLSEINHH